MPSLALCWTFFCLCLSRSLTRCLLLFPSISMKHVSAIKERRDNERKYFINWKIRMKETKNWGRHHHQAFGGIQKKIVPSFKNEHTYWFSFSYTYEVRERERVGEWKYFFSMTSSSCRQSFQWEKIWQRIHLKWKVLRHFLPFHSHFSYFLIAPAAKKKRERRQKIIISNGQLPLESKIVLNQ